VSDERLSRKNLDFKWERPIALRNQERFFVKKVAGRNEEKSAKRSFAKKNILKSQKWLSAAKLKARTKAKSGGAKRSFINQNLGFFDAKLRSSIFTKTKLTTNRSFWLQRLFKIRVIFSKI
jgi:hypothetical protein